MIKPYSAAGGGMPAARPITVATVAELRRKRLLRSNPKFLFDRSVLLSWSRRWAGHVSNEEASGESFTRLFHLSEERTPRIRVCLQLDQEYWFRDVRKPLAERGVPYTRVALKDHNQAWYFLSDLEGLRSLLSVVPETAVTGADINQDDDDRWRQRISIPFDQENYHLHLSYYLHDRNIRFVRVACEAENLSWYFLNTATDVQSLLNGLNAFEDVVA